MNAVNPSSSSSNLERSSLRITSGSAMAPPPASGRSTPIRSDDIPLDISICIDVLSRHGISSSGLPPRRPPVARRSAAMAAGRRARSQRSPVGELVQLVGKPQNLVSYHLAELRDAGLVSARRSSADGRDVYYRADSVPLPRPARRRRLGLHPGLAAHGGSRPAQRWPRPARDRACCSCAPATAPAPRSPRPSSNTDRRAPSRHAARAAIPSRCTRTRCGSWRSAASTSPVAPRSRSPASPATDSTGSSRCATRCARSARSSRARRSPRTGASPTPPPPATATRRRTPRSQHVADEIEGRVALLAR